MRYYKYIFYKSVCVSLKLRSVTVEKLLVYSLYLLVYRYTLDKIDKIPCRYLVP